MLRNEHFKECKAGMWVICDQGLYQAGWESESWLSVTVLSFLLSGCQLLSYGLLYWWEVLMLPTLAGVLLQKVLDWWTCLSTDFRSRSTISFFLHIFQMLEIWTRYFLGRLSDKKEIHTSDQHKLPARLNNLNRKQTELGRISNLKWKWGKFLCLGHTSKKAGIAWRTEKWQLPGEYKGFQDYISKRNRCS